jgi:hypothetical protein
LEAEEIGVEHLLRDVKDTTVSDLTTNVTARLNSLKALQARLMEIEKYLNFVINKELPVRTNKLKFKDKSQHTIHITGCFQPFTWFRKSRDQKLVHKTNK